MQRVLGFLVATYMVFVKYTTRWTVTGQKHVDEVIAGGNGFIVLTWHSRFLMLNAIDQGQPQKPHVLISRSRDGAVVHYTAHALGLKTIRGSSGKTGSERVKGGSGATKEMVRVLERGDAVVITPDGPRGPRQRLGEGPIRLARLSGYPIITCMFSVNNRKTFNSWDRFILPLPFGRGQITWSKTFHVPADADNEQIETLRQTIENEMNVCLAQADGATKHERTGSVG